MNEWRTHTPQYDGHAPDDWEHGFKAEMFTRGEWEYLSWRPNWNKGYKYRYHPLQDATHEPDLLAQCLRLPQADRDALIEALQKPQRDWADDVWDAAHHAYFDNHGVMAGAQACNAAAAVIRSMCRPKEEN